ncbi:MAG TPA: phosphonate ABC transporter ATP-binding protein [Chloroflexota bacterium]|nr:phosphonate ABC transporter ATP-binding protein [Chloroflexota bacterium]
MSLSVPPGQMLAIIGLSGAGKSTFLRCVNRLVEPTSGIMLVEGRNVVRADFRQLRQGIGMIFQQFNLVKRLSVLKNVLTGRLACVPVAASWFHRFSPEDVDIAFDCLQRVGIEDKAYDRADNLSGGQQQRVAIARALAQRPRIMLADEPVASLDPETSRVVLGYLRQINQDDGITTIVNLHQLEYAREYADRIIGFRHGQVVFDGAPGEVNEDVYQTIYVA